METGCDDNGSKRFLKMAVLSYFEEKLYKIAAVLTIQNKTIT